MPKVAETPIDGKYGIEETKDVFRLISTTVQAIKKANEDGETSTREMLVIGGKVAAPLISAGIGAKQIPKELSDLSVDEITELYDEFGDAIQNPKMRHAFLSVAIALDAVYDVAMDARQTEEA